jgi:predicted Zn-dependent protease
MTNRRIHLITGAAVAVVSALVLLPYVQFSGDNRGQVNFYSLEDERRLGREAAREVEKTVPVVRDPAVSEYLRRVGTTIASTAGSAGVAYEFRMLDTPVVHAFALPGGFVYVTRGMVLAVQNEAQLAGVIAHEIAHVAARHGTQQLSREELLTFITAVGDAFLVGLMYPHERPSAVRKVDTLSYSRADETQADDLAVGFLYAARYQPEGLATFFDLVRRPDQEGRLQRFLSTHPPSGRRATRIRERIAAWALDDQWIRDSPAFREVRRIVSAYAAGAPRPAGSAQR